MILEIVAIICCIELLLNYKAKSTSVVLLVILGIWSLISIVAGLMASPIFLLIGIPFFISFGVGIHLRNEVHTGYFPKAYIWANLIYLIADILIGRIL